MHDNQLTLDQIKPLADGRVGLAVLGFPINHSLSPHLHNAALAQLAFHDEKFKNWKYGKVELAASDLGKALPKLWDCGYKGLNLTIPHKVEVLPLLSSIDPAAEIMGAVNTLVWKEDGWHGCNTDGYGLEAGLRESLSVELENAQVLILGAGGAARAAAAQCLKSRCKKIWLANRSIGRLTEVVHVLSKTFGSKRIQSFALDSLPNEVGNIKGLVIINATSLGLKREDLCPIELDGFDPSCKIYDMIYNPAVTKLLEQAKYGKMSHANGLSMLVHQAARALELWTQESVSVSAMYSGVRA
ncbi:MAG: shikimate dehydrogenase [Opitutales bacterium]|nr:shikimate dehydrogenase [Opitutales bacterium]